MLLTIIIFLLVYIAMAVGFLPGFNVDRTGAATIGAFAMISFGIISPSQAWNSIDYSTICILFGLMVISSSFIVSGFYDWATTRIASLQFSPCLLLAVIISVGGVLSALLTNDVVIVAMMPLLISMTISRGLNPIPFILGLCFISNTAASDSLIGSPQNMIVAQGLDLSFMGLLRMTAIPSVLSFPIIWAVLVLLYRKNWYLSKATSTTSAVISIPKNSFNIIETIKAGVITLIVIITFIVTDIPREQIVLSAAGFLLLSRKISSNDILKHVDSNLLLLTMGLFIINSALSETGLPHILLNNLNHIGINLNNPIVLFFVTSILSNVVGNNPSIMLLISFLQTGDNNDALGAALALGSGFSSNMFIFCSLAGIIAVEQAKRYGIKISFVEFMKSGLIVTIICMLIATLNVLLLK